MTRWVFIMRGKSKKLVTEKIKSDESSNNKKGNKILPLKRQNKKSYVHTSEEEEDLKNMLLNLNLKIREIKGDGNCMFRTIADQLIGNEHEYDKYRQIVCDYIEENEEHFKFFIEDDEIFSDYLKRMREDGQWGGQQELYAAAQSLQMNITVHQANAPRFVFLCVKCSTNAQHRTIHLSYHGECHYNSVRHISDNKYDQPALNIDLQDNDHSTTRNTSLVNLDSERNSKESQVLKSIPWASFQDIKIALDMTDNDIDDAIEVLMANPGGLVNSVDNENTSKSSIDYNEQVNSCPPNIKTENETVISQDDKKTKKKHCNASCIQNRIQNNKTMSKKDARKLLKLEQQNLSERSRDTQKNVNKINTSNEGGFNNEISHKMIQIIV